MSTIRTLSYFVAASAAAAAVPAVAIQEDDVRIKTVRVADGVYMLVGQGATSASRWAGTARF